MWAFICMIVKSRIWWTLLTETATEYRKPACWNYARLFYSFISVWCNGITIAHSSNFKFACPGLGLGSKILKSEAPGSEKRNLPCKVENTRLFWRKRRRMLSLLNGTQIRPFLMRNENYYPYKFFVRPYLTLSKNSLKILSCTKDYFLQKTWPVHRTVGS